MRQNKFTFASQENLGSIKMFHTTESTVTHPIASTSPTWHGVRTRWLRNSNGMEQSWLSKSLLFWVCIKRIWSRSSLMSKLFSKATSNHFFWSLNFSMSYHIIVFLNSMISCKSKGIIKMISFSIKTPTQQLFILWRGAQLQLRPLLKLNSKILIHVTTTGDGKLSLQRSSACIRLEIWVLERSLATTSSLIILIEFSLLEMADKEYQDVIIELSHRRKQTSSS